MRSEVGTLRKVLDPGRLVAGPQRELRSGFSVPVTLEFRNAGSVTLEVPIHTYTDVSVDRIPQPLTVE